MNGQVTLEQYLSSRDGLFPSCKSCICRSCLFWWSSRCPCGRCADDKRAKEELYDKMHQEKSLRKQWSNWNKPGEQAYWCRGGSFYPIHYCESFVKYTKAVTSKNA